MNPNAYRLAIETATAWGSVAIGAGDEVIVEVAIAGHGGRGSRRPSGGHSAALLPAIDFGLATAGVRPQDLAALVVGSGPGSFTGIRIAGATAKGITHARDIPLFAFSSLLAAAAPWGRQGATVCAMFDARGRDVFAACYRFGSRIEAVVPPAAMTLDRAIEHCRGWRVGVVTGDAVLRHRAELEGEAGVLVAPESAAYPRASSLLQLLRAQPESGRVDDPAGWEPDYLRPSGAERIAGERAAATAR